MWPVAHLGHGIGLRTAHYSYLLENPPAGVDWFEIISENFFEPGGRPWAVLDKIRREKPIVAHGVALGVGNAAPISDSYLAKLKLLIHRIEPAWVSDHLCWGSHGGFYAHDLLPLPYTEESLVHVIERVQLIQESLRRPIMLENVSSYVSFVQSTINEWEFLNEVSRRSGCGILLDINNVYVSAYNHKFDAQRYIDEIDVRSVGQLHLAGHTNFRTYLLDSHIGPTPEEVWTLYRRAVHRMGRVPTLVEWDEEVPSFEEVAREAQKAREIEQEVLSVA